mmetsp:Transcript_4739/g.18948  ORF Transcript_4739/g.18948 Transcript_4739/m.18948 type:complete len:287 (+) Transcript_4739:28-888(+)
MPRFKANPPGSKGVDGIPSKAIVVAPIGELLPRAWLRHHTIAQGKVRNHSRVDLKIRALNSEEVQCFQLLHGGSQGAKLALVRSHHQRRRGPRPRDAPLPPSNGVLGAQLDTGSMRDRIRRAAAECRPFRAFERSHVDVPDVYGLIGVGCRQDGHPLIASGSITAEHQLSYADMQSGIWIHEGARKYLEQDKLQRRGNSPDVNTAVGSSCANISIGFGDHLDARVVVRPTTAVDPIGRARTFQRRYNRLLLGVRKAGERNDSEMPISEDPREGHTAAPNPPRESSW